MFVAGEAGLSPGEGLSSSAALAMAGPINESDFFTWEALIAGPSETPFEGGVFSAFLSFPRDYPLSPPKVRRITTLCSSFGPHRDTA